MADIRNENVNPFENRKDDYESYIREYHADNPDIGSLLARWDAVLETSEGCAGVIEAFASDLSGTYTERLDKLGEHLEKNGTGKGNINTYPFGRPTREIHPEFVGICKGKTTLKSVLNKAEDQCEKMIRRYPRHVDKTIMILTDKWDAPLFKSDYAGTFINYANRENIVFIFLLVTDFGVKRIPFLTWNRRKLLDRGSWNVAWGARHRAKEELVTAMDNLIKHGRCMYWKHSKNADNRKNDFHCKFDFELQEYSFERKTGLKYGEIPVRALEKFAVAVREYADLPETLYEKTGEETDSDLHVAEIFGRQLVWYKTEDPFYTKLEKAFDNLMKSLKVWDKNE